MGSLSKVSKTRQALRQLVQRLPEVLQDAMSVRGEVLAASLSKTQKKCGKPNCKCALGEKHVVYQLSWTKDGRRRSAHIRPGDLLRLKDAVDRYRRLRQCRADLLKIASEAAALIDVLTETLGVPPPE